MRLCRIDLGDVGRFNRFSADLSGQLVGVCGQNGSGKSTLLSAVHYAVTGDLSRLGGRDAVRVGWTSANEQPYVSLMFLPETGAEEAVILRKLPAGDKDGYRRLAYKDRVVTAQADITRLVERWTGLSVKTLSDFVFVAQGELDAVVRAKPAERAEILHRLFGVDVADKARAAAVAHLASLPEAPGRDVLDALTIRAAQIGAARDGAAEELSRIPQVDVDQAKSDQALLDRYTAQIAAYRTRAVLTDRITRTEDELAKPLPPAHDPTMLAGASDICKRWGLYNQAVQSAKTQNLLAVAAAQSIPPDPGPEPTPADELIALKDKKFAFNVILSAPETGSKCPVCHGPLSPDMGDKETARAAMGRILELEAEYYKELTKHKRAVDAHRSAVAEAEFAADRAEKSKTAIPDRPDIDEEQAKQFVKLHQTRKIAFDADAAERERLTRVLTADKKALADLDAKTGVFIPDVEATAARRRHTERLELKAVRAAAESKLVALETATKEAEEAVESARMKSEAATGRLSEWRARVEYVRDALHRDAAPAAAAKSCLEDLSTDLNRRLGHLAARYRISVNADGNLVAEFRDGTATTKLAVTRLSGGEKVVLGLAWRLALLDRYAPKVGLLCLDEPTTGLDADRVGALRSALEAWRPHGTDRQFVVVTHERRLMDVFDAVVSL